jgi:hypothetical protein
MVVLFVLLAVGGAAGTLFLLYSPQPPTIVVTAVQLPAFAVGAVEAGPKPECGRRPRSCVATRSRPHRGGVHEDTRRTKSVSFPRKVLLVVACARGSGEERDYGGKGAPTPLPNFSEVDVWAATVQLGGGGGGVEGYPPPPPPPILRLWALLGQPLERALSHKSSLRGKIGINDEI